MEYGRNNEQHARDTIGRVHSRYLLFPFTHSISAHRPDHDHLDCPSFPRKSRLYPFTALASGTTAFSIRLNVIRGPFHCYVDGRNGRGGGIDRIWGGSIKGDDRYEGRFCVYGSGWLWKVLRVRRLYFLLFPPCCVFALLTNSSIGRHSSVLVLFNPPTSHSLGITLSAHPVFLWHFAILALCSP